MSRATCVVRALALLAACCAAIAFGRAQSAQGDARSSAPEPGVQVPDDTPASAPATHVGARQAVVEGVIWLVQNQNPGAGQ